MTLLPLALSRSRRNASSFQVGARGWLNTSFWWYASAFPLSFFIKVDVIFTILGFRSLGTQLKITDAGSTEKRSSYREQ